MECIKKCITHETFIDIRFFYWEEVEAYSNCRYFTTSEPYKSALLWSVTKINIKWISDNWQQLGLVASTFHNSHSFPHYDFLRLQLSSWIAESISYKTRPAHWAVLSQQGCQKWNPLTLVVLELIVVYKFTFFFDMVSLSSFFLQNEIFIFLQCLTNIPMCLSSRNAAPLCK